MEDPSTFPKKSPSRVPFILAPQTFGPLTLVPSRDTTDKKLEEPTALKSFPAAGASNGYKFKFEVD